MEPEYTVVFTNLIGCAIGISDICWSTKVTTESEEAAIEVALRQASAVSGSRGMPPHAIRLTEAQLREIAFVNNQSAGRGDPAAV